MSLIEKLNKVLEEISLIESSFRPSSAKVKRDRILRKFKGDDVSSLILQDLAYAKERTLRKELGDEEYEYRDNLVKRILGLSYAEALVLKSQELYDVIVGSPVALKLYSKKRVKVSQLPDDEKFIYFLLDCIRVRHRPKVCLDVALDQAKKGFAVLKRGKDFYDLDDLL